VRLALDTNILAYAEGVGDDVRCTTARELVSRLPVAHTVLPAQALGELYRVLTAKAARSPAEARQNILAWSDSFSVADSTWESFQGALDLASDHHLPIWDALILSVAAENHTRLLLSEDFQAGYTWRGVTIVNPFAPALSPLLKVALEAD